ncbi:hypothetical protein O0L34_g15464 [Tuta absoluta]|nr:hypothetical protein O0L34_g15464 [Tuta absoluta]
MQFASPVPESAAGGSSSSSSSSSPSSSSSSSSTSSSSESDSPDAAANAESADDSSAALAAACQLQVIDDADLAALFPEQTAPPPQPNFSAFAEHAASPDHTDKSIADNGDGSSSEMELTPQLVTAAIQRATADSSGSENECSNSDNAHHNTTHYASSLLQQFVAQTQLLSSTAPLPGTSLVGLNPNPIEGVGSISDCVLGQINTLPEITPIAPNFLTDTQHLSPQQTEELKQINKDLEEITSVTESVGIAIPHPPSLEDCVDNDFMNIAQSTSDIGNASDMMKNSPLTVNTDMGSMNVDTQKFDTASTHSVESQEDVKTVVVESRRKRGRPRKVPLGSKKLESRKVEQPVVNVINDFHNGNDPPNVSPDSGILSNHNSPTHSPVRRHDDDAQNRLGRKAVQKENNTRERRSARSKSKSRSRAHRSDSSDCDYRKKRIENEIKQIKTEAPSPIPLKQDQNKYEKAKKNDHKLDIAALDRMLYATDRVLYPPRKKVGRKPQNKAKSPKSAPKTLKDKNQYDSIDSEEESIPTNRSVLSGVYAKRKELNSKLANLPKKTSKTFGNTWRDNQSENEAAVEDHLDPTWKQIDLNPKYKDILSGYKSDHEIKPYKSCSRLMESGYKSDYGGCRSGYKSDYHRSSGYKTDYKSGYKSDKSGYKTDYSVRSMRRRTRKLKKTRSVRDRSYYKNQKHFVSDQEILLLSNKTFSSLNLGHSSSDSECDSYLRKPNASPKYVSVCTKYPLPSNYNFGFTKLNKKLLRVNPNDPFAPGPVFSGLQRPVMTYNIFKLNHNNNNTLVKSPTKSSYIGKPLPALKPSFTHKFGASPISAVNKLSGLKKDDKNSSRTLSPRNRKSKHSSPQTSASKKKETVPKPLPGIFEKAKNSYIPNKLLSRNVFLNAKKPHIKPSFHTKKHRRTVVLAPPKINLKPSPTERPSRVTVKTENKHHRHRSKRRHRSRSVSRCRDTKAIDLIDQKFTQDLDNLVSNFIKLCQVAAPKLVSVPQCSPRASPRASPKHTEKPVVENKTEPPPPATTKVVKRGSKKRKTADNPEIAAPTTKRRHKKQQAESQNKGGKDTNEHKLPLKKRHYHINSSTSNSLSLTLMPSEFEESSKNGTSPEKFLCTEMDCMGETQNSVSAESPKLKTYEKAKRVVDSNKNVAQSPNSAHETKTSNTETTPKQIKPAEKSDSSEDKITENASSPTKNHSSNSLNATDDELSSIKKPGADQSELSKKIYETSEKLKAVHKMVHDLEKSLPKTKDSEVKTDTSKQEARGTASPRAEAKQSPMRHSAPIVTPKKRHRLEADKAAANSSLDQVVQSLSKKLSEDKTSATATATKDVNQNNSMNDSRESDVSGSTSPSLLANANIPVDPLKSMSARTLYKSAIPPAQKSEIMTRKKNRLEGLTSNLVSKINPSAATKVLDTLLNNNIRKSIESRILEKEKNSGSESPKSNEDKSKNTSQINTRATVIKSPVSKGKVLETKKSKAQESATPTVVVNVDKPTGIFEPSVDLEDQIPKSSISVNNATADSSKSKSKTKSDIKNSNPLLTPIDTESEIPLALISETPEPIIRPKRGESIAAALSDKLQETGGHNLRQTKRNLSKETEHESDDTTDKKKKKTSGALIRESKLVLPSKMLIPKVQAERLPISDNNKKTIVTAKSDQKEPSEGDEKKPVVEVSKKKARRRKAINRTGFPSVKKKKKKMEPSIQLTSDSHFTSDTDNNSSAFERVPKDGEAMSSFIERTNTKKPELKVVLNKDECPKQARLTVVALEKLQGKEVPLETNKSTTNAVDNDKKNTSTSILRAPALQLKQSKPEKEVKSHVNKWEVLSETDSIPSLASSSNDPEDCIPLSLLNLKERSSSRSDNLDRMKRKTRALSPSQEIEEILSKRKNVENNSKMGLRPKSSLAVLCPSERRQTRSFDTATDEPKTKPQKSESKKPDSVEKPDKPAKPVSIATRRKSRSCQANKKIREVQSSSRESSLDTVVSRRLACKSREPSVDTLRDHDENDPLPLNEKEIDFEKSIDVLSKSIICKKRVASSRDESPASSVDNREKAPVVSKRNPRLRKKFLVAGLFSDYYKEDPKPEGKGKNLVTQTEFPPGLLSPPPYCERWVRRRTVHFTLPYDIWWQHHYNQPVPSWNYKKIRTNVYYDVKPSADECESVACNCAPASGCNEDCINRLVFAECSSQLCPCGDKCKNQRIQRHEWAGGLEKFMTESKGWGVRTKETIAAGDFILEYVGEVVSDKEFKERMATRYARDTHHYCLHLDGGTVIDGHRVGGDGRFVNHSCRPNCEMQKWTSNGTFRMALFALRDIDPGEELTYDYNFSLFNPAEGQPCKCDSIDCRGVIGGKSQRVTKLPIKSASRTPSNASNQSASSAAPRPGRPRKAAKSNKKSEQQNILAQDIKNNMTILKYQQHLNKLWQEPQLKPLSAKERTLVKERHCFLFRNLEQVRRIRERLAISMEPSPPPPGPAPAPPPSPAPVIPSTPVVTMVDPLQLPDTMNPRIFIDRLQKLREGGKEKKLLRVEDDPSLSKKERWGKVLKAIYSAVVEAKDEKDKLICAPLLKPKPSKSESSSGELGAVSAALGRGQYESAAQFDAAMSAVLTNALREQGRLSAAGAAALQLRKIYNAAKAAYVDQLTKILGPDEPLPPGFLAKTKTEEVILCICGLHVEEGLMVQCGGARCGVWQHARCMRVRDTRAPHYCHHCSKREVDREIPLDDYTEEGHQFYLSLMRGDLQVRQGDTVYVLRDIPIDDKHPDVSQKGGDKGDSPKTKRQDRKKVKNLGKGKDKEEPSTGKECSVRKHTYQTIGSIPVSELDIFRVERLWKHKDTQERYVYGHHYLRPHETFHEPTRKFFHNEVMRVPLYEAVPIELVMSQCWVMDLNTYCKGRPVGASEQHVYICELRVDRTARLFTKVSRPKYPIPTKHYAFHHYPQRAKLTRTYAPHEVSPEYLKGRGAKNFPQPLGERPAKTPADKDNKKKPSALALVDTNKPAPALPPAARRQQQKERVNNIARRLLARLGTRAPLDASYLLQPRRPRHRAV